MDQEINSESKPKRTLYIVPIEPLQTRYTGHWYTHLPRLLERNVGHVYDVVQLDIPYDDKTTAGAFLNFASTISYKSKQITMIADMFSAGKINENDVFLFTDYWNTCASSVRYMSELLEIPVKIAGICHAGVWDKADILGRISKHGKHKAWWGDVESELEELYDAKFFATEFSRYLYEKNIAICKTHKNHVTGFPMEYYNDYVMLPYWELETPPAKENIVLFPHRKSPEKHYELFLRLKEELPQYKFVVSLDETNNKEEYHNLLYRSKVVFTAALQETLGISVGIEALKAQCNIVAPDRLSYKEVLFSEFKYDANIASSYSYTEDDVKALKREIVCAMELYDESIPSIIHNHDRNQSTYFNGEGIYKQLCQM